MPGARHSGYFVSGPEDGGPLSLIAGGSGVVPFRAMLRHRDRTGSEAPTRLLYSSRTLVDVIYRAELEQSAPGLEVVQTLTRSRPAGWVGYDRGVDLEMLREVAWPAEASPLAYVCGPTSFVETVAESLVDLGYAPARVKTDRFGATGGRMMEALDGNAIARLLQDVFGGDMTTVPGVCPHCGDSGCWPSPGCTHARPASSSAVDPGLRMVLVTRTNVTCVHLQVTLGVDHSTVG